MKNLFTLCILFLSIHFTVAGKEKAFILLSGKSPVIAYNDKEEAVVNTALQLFSNDCRQVLNTKPIRVTSGGVIPDIFVGTIQVNPEIEKITDVKVLQGKHEAFLIKVVQYQGKSCLVIAGSDKRGTAYGILQLSRLIGVSPWEWWADATPKALKIFKLPAKYTDIQQPSVPYRGIFINDEDWGLTPWSWQTYEPSKVKGQIGPKTHARIFELLLRLRGNTFWPAMHSCSVPFYFTPGNKEMADKYGIILGTSHCEPMMRNTNGEWKRDGKGEYDYIHNKENVLAFWEQRVREVAHSDNYYTIGMRGVHDGKMQGAKTIDEQKKALTDIIQDQREMLEKFAQGKKREDIPQVFIPYKEVLDIYDAGLEVPEDVTLMWCDDNYGYIRHFPTKSERTRKGGNGIYYHISYWGRPHDYLWLSTTNPALVYMQMKQAYDYGIQKLWIVNVGDIKPGEYVTELFMDMAWDIRRVEKEGVQTHLKNWLAREFGEKNSGLLLPVLREYYRLAYMHKPEFMGNTRTEEKAPQYQIINDLPWSEKEIHDRLVAYQKIADKAETISKQIAPDKMNAYYQLIKYPVLAAAEMNKKLLYAQLARHNKADWSACQTACDSITALTRIYNTQNNGKWNHMMDDQPRNLPVFKPVKPSKAQTPLLEITPLQLLNGMDFSQCLHTPIHAQGLGYREKAVAIQKNNSLTYKLRPISATKIRIEIRLVPNHPVENDQLRFALSVDQGEEQQISYKTRGRSEEWKNNVLWNQAIRNVTLPLNVNLKQHEITIKALDEGVILDQIAIYAE